jgi:hypothetical protein
VRGAPPAVATQLYALRASGASGDRAQSIWSVISRAPRW